VTGIHGYADPEDAWLRLPRTVHLLVAIEVEDDRTAEEVRAAVERELSADLADVLLLTHSHDDGAAPRPVDLAGRQRAERVACERTAYLAAVIRALMRREPTLESYLSPICPECGQIPEQGDGDHVVLGAALVIGCEGYWLINPNAVGIHRSNWQPQE
jgi:hypothetical protein